MTRHVTVLLRLVGMGLAVWLVAGACRHVPTKEPSPQHIEQSRDVAALERFARTHPDSPLAARAKQRALALREEKALEAFRSVENATKASLIERFMLDNPYPRVVTLGKLRIAEIDFSDVANDNPFRPARPGNGSFESFANFYAFTDYIPVPQDPELRKTYYAKLHPLLIRALGQVNSFDLWMRYFSVYSENPYFTQAGEELEKFLFARPNKWQVYEMLRAYLALYEQRLKRPCPNRDKLIRQFQEGLAEVVEQEDTMAEYRHYLEVFPDSFLKDRITRKMDHLVLLEACVRRDRAKIQEFIQRYEKDKDPLVQNDLRQAINQLEQMEYKDALVAGTPAALRDFIGRYKDRDYAKLVADTAGRLQRMHDQMLVKAKAAGKPDLYREFLRHFPDTTQRAEVERDLEEAEFRAAIARNDRTALQDLLARYPNSRMRQSALDFLEDQDFKRDKAQALEEPSTAPLRRFLDSHPKGRRAAEVQELLKRINESHIQYVEALQRARQMHNASQFATFLIEQPNNHYVAQRGQKDLESLRRELATEQLVSDLMTTPTASSKAIVPIALSRALSEYGKSVAFVETNVGASTGFVFGPEGLLLTNAYIVRNATKIAVKMAGRTQAGKVVYLAEPDGLDLAVLRIEGRADPIPVGNSAALATPEEIIALWAQGLSVENARGSCLGIRRAGSNEWLVIQSAKIPTNLGGVVLNQRARAIGILIPPDQVDSTIREKLPDRVYALSLRSALPILQSAIVSLGQK